MYFMVGPFYTQLNETLCQSSNFLNLFGSHGPTPPQDIAQSKCHFGCQVQRTEL